MSPRRSSRARTTQPVHSVPHHTNSSTSSISSGRAERSTRSHHKLVSPQTSIPPRSLSLDDLEDPTRPQSQRSKNGHEQLKPDLTIALGDEEDEEIEEEGVTRCICGHQEYPGLPGCNREAAKIALKLNVDPKSTTIAAETFPEDAGGLFIQCDTCKVWQHGGCVGILDEPMSPEEYFCEECRKDLHKITIAPNGQKSSLYLPVQDANSAEASPEPPTRDRNSRRSKEAKALGLSAEAMSGKRRSTMNSRDAAYDEAEQLRRAIEESKKQGSSASVDTSIRRGKRSRSDSEERKDDIKRQRTNSGSSSSPLNSKHSLSNADSDEDVEVNHKMGDGSLKKNKGTGSRNTRDKEALEREKEREKQRADAAGRRKGRAERRRADDSDPSDETSIPRPTSANNPEPTTDAPPSSQPNPSTPPVPHDPPPAKPSHRRTGRPPTKRGRVGRNQYTKDRDIRLELNGGDLDPAIPSPLRSRSRDNGQNNSAGVDSPHNNNNGSVTNAHHLNGDPTARHPKLKHLNPLRTSLNEMKRRVAAILEFIGRTQVEMASAAAAAADTSGSTPPPPPLGKGQGPEGEGEGEGSSQQAFVKGLMAGLGELAGGVEEGREFGELSSAQMMDSLTGRLVRWQLEFGKWGER